MTLSFFRLGLVYLVCLFCLISSAETGFAQTSNAGNVGNGEQSSDLGDAGGGKQVAITGDSGGGKDKKKTFAELRDERSDLLAEIPRLRAERDRISRELRNLEDENAFLESELRSIPTSDTKSLDVVRAEERILGLEARKKHSQAYFDNIISNLQSSLEAKRSADQDESSISSGDELTIEQLENSILDERSNFERELADVDSEIRIAQAELKAILNRSSQREAEMRTRIIQIRQSTGALQSELDEIELQLQTKTDRQFEVENEINLQLIPETAENEFKLYITIAFASLVGVVIIGFFFMAFTDEKVRQAIFSGQAGIQFLTLFSLVIAIILFGMTGILGDKELAALLGGISGYILGRVAPSSQDS